LFPDSDAAALPAVAAPEFFRDLNLDQLVAAIVVARHDYDLTPFFHAPLAGLDAPIAFPQPAPAGARTYECAGLYDVCLALSMRRRIVGNALHADGKSLVVITGANQGGKSSFLRGVGLAHLMMQAGMFVAAESFGAALCTALFTHYKREEDVAMKKGKLDEELSRMSDIAAALTPDALVLFNESFAATNEREGAEIAGQVVRALLEQRVRIFFVTHLYAFAHGAHERLRPDAVFLRAERLADGTRTFKLAAAEPLETSYGVDVYREVFAEETEEGTP
jgi:DNA mismatch repair ATPase MutS